jgi:WXG100 family type VII secretion target
VTGAGIPEQWQAVEDAAAKVEKVDPAAIQGAADEFVQASEGVGDHGAALKSATDGLQGGGVWDGPAADAFFSYVSQVAEAGNKVKDKLDEVAEELGRLQQTLHDIKQRIETVKTDAKATIDDNNAEAQATADSLQAAIDNDTWHPPMNTPQQVIEQADRDNEATARQAAKQIDDLLRQADEAMTRAQELMKTEVEGGFSKVGPPGSGATAPSSTGGISGGGDTPAVGGGSSGGSSGGTGGGGAVGGGGLGPSGGPPASGPPPGNVEQWIREAIKILQANGIPVTEADIQKIWTIIEKESGGDPHAINNWDCVPLDTMILTRRGWLKHDEVRPGDETVGYNPATRHSEWTRVTRVVHHDDVPLLRLGNSRWHATTTPNHRWLNLPRISGSREPQFVSTGEISGRHRVLLSAPAVTTPCEADPGSDAVARVLAMSGEQRAAWLEAIIDAEGTRQAPATELDAVALAVYLSGARPCVLHSTRPNRPQTWQADARVRPNGPVVTGNVLAVEDAGRADVWCVTTELGTWTAREDEHIFLTGNSNAAKGTPSKGLMQCIDPTFQAHALPGHGDIWNPVDNIIAGVRYTFDRYGGFDGHPGLASMAAGGGYQGY